MNDEKEFWKDLFKKWDISMKEEDANNTELDDYDVEDFEDSELDFVDLSLNIEDDPYFPSPEGFEQILSPCCEGQIIILWNKYSNKYIGICEECGRDLLELNRSKFILHDLKLIKR